VALQWNFVEWEPVALGCLGPKHATHMTHATAPINHTTSSLSSVALVFSYGKCGSLVLGGTSYLLHELHIPIIVVPTDRPWPAPCHPITQDHRHPVSNSLGVELLVDAEDPHAPPVPQLIPSIS
jgi:hypothetical protein